MTPGSRLRVKKVSYPSAKIYIYVYIRCLGEKETFL